MIKTIVASKNPVKIEAVKIGFEKMFPGIECEFVGISVPSGVSDQPLSDEETLRGARNRCQRVYERFEDADYWVGVEGGIEKNSSEMAAFAWIVVKSGLVFGKGRTATFVLPRKISDLIDQGIELGEADDIVFGESNSKQNAGAVGLLTDNVIDRARLYSEGVILALIPFKNAEIYKNE